MRDAPIPTTPTSRQAPSSVAYRTKKNKCVTKETKKLVHSKKVQGVRVQDSLFVVMYWMYAPSPFTLHPSVNPIKEKTILCIYVSPSDTCAKLR